MNEEKKSVNCHVSFVFSEITESERDRIMAEIHEIALEIALGSEEDGLCEVRVG